MLQITSIKTENIGFEKDVFISAANFKYPTLKLNDLKQLNISSIAADNCILFMWTTGPQFANSIELGWDNWGLEIPDNKIEIFSQEDIDVQSQLTLNLL